MKDGFSFTITKVHIERGGLRCQILDALEEISAILESEGTPTDPMMFNNEPYGAITLTLTSPDPRFPLSRYRFCELLDSVW